MYQFYVSDGKVTTTDVLGHERREVPYGRFSDHDPFLILFGLDV